ncbi:glycosyltransferase [Hyphococcus formosus]|uniref:glycosyltransferase family 2 protein n=1 Tax=Hyphococcus formosus TaxID=3143534 RepID=UPI00398B4374
MTVAVSITLTRYREPDWLVMETLASLAKQENVVGAVIFLDQNWREDFAEKVEKLSSQGIVFRCVPCDECGLSHARNEGIRLAQNDFVLFIDSDAIAEPSWAFEMARGLGEGAAIVGARILARWRGKKPLLANSRVVTDLYSLLDWGDEMIDAHRVVGAGFGINKSLFPAAMQFDPDFGRRDGKLLSGEESDLCARITALGGRITYCGQAIVHHQILPERCQFGWIANRLYFAGMARAQAGGTPSPSHKPGLWDWALLPLILPPYAAGYARKKLVS